MKNQFIRFLLFLPASSQTLLCGDEKMKRDSYKTVLGTVVLAMLANAAPALAAVRSSEALQWQYQMGADPTSQDLDGDTNVDWEANFTPTPSGGVLPMTTGEHLQMIGSVGTHLWTTANITGDYTVEARLQIGTTETEGSYGTTQITSDPAGSSYVTSWLGIKRQGQFWDPYSRTPIGGAADDNTDDFHTFRIALKGSNYFVWRDEVGLRDSTGNGAMPSVATGSNWNFDRLKIGNGSGSYRGAYDVDYVYIDDEAYAPTAPHVLPAGITYMYEFDVDPSTQDLDEDGFGFNRDWKKAGAATLSNGIAAMQTGDYYVMDDDTTLWRTQNVDDDYIVEMSVKILTEEGAEALWGTMGITADPNGAQNDNAWLDISRTGQSWAYGAIDLGDDDNTDGFHIFRLERRDGGYYVFRDDVLLNPGGLALSAASSYAGDRLKIGQLSTAGHKGQWELDYLSVYKVPEPGSHLLLWLGCLVALMKRWRR